MRRKLPILAALCVSMLATADQPFHIQPGLWKLTTTVGGGGLGAMTRNSCITADDIRNVRLLQLASGQGSEAACTSQVTRQTADALEGVVECSSPSGPSRAQVRFTASSPTRLAGNMQVAAPAGMQIGITLAGEWVAAACPAADDEEDDFDAG